MSVDRVTNALRNLRHTAERNAERNRKHYQVKRATIEDDIVTVCGEDGNFVRMETMWSYVTCMNCLNKLPGEEALNQLIGRLIEKEGGLRK